MAALPLASCMSDVDEPDTDGYLITSPTSIGEVNSTIGEVKDKYCSAGSSNFYERVNEDVIIEGVVVANDEGGNLYQTLLIRSIDEAAGTDQCIVLAVKNTCLYPYFPLGQRIKINLKGLYAGCYSKVPKIGQPYRTSSGNLRLGPMLLELCRTNIELVGEPDLNAPELVPVVPDDDWLRASANKTYKNVPMLATVTGTIDEVQGEEFADGTVVLAPNRQWVVDVTLNVAAPVITTEMKDVANCSGNSESGYAMVNYNGATLGNYSCTVKDGAMTLIFVTTVKDGRKTYTATNTFTGTLN